MRDLDDQDLVLFEGPHFFDFSESRKSQNSGRGKPAPGKLLDMTFPRLDKLAHFGKKFS